MTAHPSRVTFAENNHMTTKTIAILGALAQGGGAMSLRKYFRASKSVAPARKRDIAEPWDGRAPVLGARIEDAGETLGVGR